MAMVLEDQVRIVLKCLEGKNLTRDGPIFSTAVNWMKNWPGNLDGELKNTLKLEILRAFSINEADLIGALNGRVGYIIAPVTPGDNNDTILRNILPKKGWFQWYDEYTRYNESPLSFHTFCSLSVLGAALGRRVYLDMGFFRVWPNFHSILVGPTGRVKKTTASDIAINLIEENVICPILRDATTPEALATALKESSQQVLYAGELSTFLGKQKYNEGMVPRLLRLLDCPNSFEVRTQARGVEIIPNPTVTFLAGTTPGQLVSAMPPEVTSAGFMNRILFIMEKDTDRIFHIPRVGPNKALLSTMIKRFQGWTGEMKLSPGADKFYEEWYIARRTAIRKMTDDAQVEAVERMAGHVLRTALLVHLAQCDNLDLCRDCFEIAVNMQAYVEKSTPGLVNTLKSSPSGAEADFVYGMLIKLGGAADHSNLLRRCAPKMNAAGFKQHIRTLEESNQITVKKQGIGTHYLIIEHKETH